MRRQPDRKHFASAFSCRLDRPRSSYPGRATPLSSSSSSTLQPHPGFGVAPVPHTLLTRPTPGTSLTLTALQQALVLAARGPLQAQIRGAWVSRDSDSGPLGQGPAARRALGLDVSCPGAPLISRLHFGAQPLPPPSSGAAPLPALTPPLSISPRSAAPRGGAQGPLGSRCRGTSSSERAAFSPSARPAALSGGPWAPPAGPGWVGSPAWFR